jgi:hypothetical protein
MVKMKQHRDNYFDKKEQEWASNLVVAQATEKNGEQTCNR